MFFSPLVAEEPWGPKRCYPAQKSRDGFLEHLAEALIHFHQEVISPIDGPRSHYQPSSSQYMLDAIHEYGFFGGIPVGCDRLLRENDEDWVYPTVPFAGEYLKWDPVH